MNLRHGNWSLRAYKWHSINLLPSALLYDEADDNTYATIARVLELVIFGWVISFGCPSSKRRNGMKLLNPHGWCWSRRKRSWYKLEEPSK
jgi:hypothetical protein